MTKCVRNFSLLMAFAVVASLPAGAQAIASLTGTVTDPTGAVVRGAELTVTHLGTGATRTATTDANGKYLVPQLAPATYKVEVKMSGFKTTVNDQVPVQVGITTTLDIQLEVGAVTETVTVEARATGLNTSDASLGTPFSGAEVGSLPIVDLDPVALLGLQAGVTYVPGQADEVGGYGGVIEEDGRSGSVSGSRSDQTNVTLDGVDVNDPEKGYAFSSVLRATQASLQEFRTTTTNYNANVGRSSAAQVSLVTKSGTNEIHGSAYWAHRNEAFNANDFFLNQSGIDEPKFRRHTYGAALGGPIVKDRFFLFGNYERLEESLFGSERRDIPSLAMRDGVFVYECQDVGGYAPCPTTQTTVAGLTGSHTIPAGWYGLSPAEIAAIDPAGIGPNLAVTSHFQLFPEPNTSIGSLPPNITGFRFGAPVDNIFNTYILRADLNIDPAGKHIVFWRATMHDDTIATTPQFPGQPPSQTVLNNNKGFALGYTAVLSPSLVNNFRWGLTRVKEQRAGLQDGSYVDFRFISNQQDYASNSLGRTIPQHHIRDDISWTVGRHTLSFGGEIRYTRNDRFSNANSFHYLVTNSSWLPDGGRAMAPGQSGCAAAGCFLVPAVADAFGASYRDGMVQLLGVVPDGTAYYNFDRDGNTLAPGEPVRREFGVDEYEAYAQDQWRVTPALTLTYGVRFSVASPPWETRGNQVLPQIIDSGGQIVPGMGLSEWFELRRELMLAGRPTNDAGRLTFDLGGKANGRPGYYDWDWNNWSPRVAVAWAPQWDNWFSGNGKLVFRGGYSLVYDRIGNALATTFDEGGSFGMSTALDGAFGQCTVATCPRFTDPLDTAGLIAALLAPSPGGGFPATPPDGFTFIDQALDNSITTPYSHTINVTIARELPGDLTVEAAYVGRRGRDLLFVRDLAMPADFVDPVSGVSAFQGARDLIGYAEQNAGLADGGLNALAPMPFWENVFPSFGPTGTNGGCLQWEIFAASGCGFSATQVAYDYMIGYHGTPAAGAGFGAVTFWWDVDLYEFPGYAVTGPWTFFPSQYGDLQAWGSVARSEYHSFQLTARKRMSHGVLFNLNYTLSKSLDHGSSPERADVISPQFFGSYSGSAINAWEIDKEYSFSDFDMRHQFNASWVVELPVGRDIAGWANQILGGWEISGIWRMNSGLPAGIYNGRTWPTNWDLQGSATCAPAGSYRFGLTFGPCPATQNVSDTVDGHGPNLFRDPNAAFEHFRFTAPPERGGRNDFRADKYFNLDLGIAKSFNMPWEGHRFMFRWDMFNLTNSTYFDAISLDVDIETRATFGTYDQVMGRPRRMQVSLRYEF